MSKRSYYQIFDFEYVNETGEKDDWRKIDVFGFGHKCTEREKDLLEYLNTRKAELAALREEKDRWRRAVETWKKMPTDKDADEWEDTDFELSKEFAALMNAAALSELEEEKGKPIRFTDSEGVKREIDYVPGEPPHSQEGGNGE